LPIIANINVISPEKWHSTSR